jgi:hypothetical protein
MLTPHSGGCLACMDQANQQPTPPSKASTIDGTHARTGCCCSAVVRVCAVAVGKATAVLQAPRCRWV